LINAPDDVVPEATGGSSTTGGNGGTGNVGNVGNGGNAGDGGDGTSGSSGSAGSAGSAGTGVGGDGMGGGGGGGAEAGAGGEGGSGVDPATGGLIVIGAENKEVPPKRVLSVLTASNGDELVREVLPVAAIAYDDADKLWYVFKAAQFPAQGLSTADLEVRRFNDDTGLWSTLGTATALPPPQPDQFVVLNDRLVYLSYQVVGGAPVSAITVLNTANPAAVTELATRPAAAGSTYEGVIGDRGSDVDANAVGGRLRLMISSGCTGNDCALAAQLVSVANGLTDLTSVNLGRYAGQPRFVRARTEDKVYMALRSLSPANRMEVRGYTGLALTNPTTFTFSVVTGDNVGGFDLVECATAGLFSDVAGSQLIAFNLRSGAARVQPLGHPGAPVYTEPYGQQAIVLDSSAAPGLRSFEVSQSGQNNVAINLRTTWDPPEDLKPLTGATRRGATCQ
jgi:hypothetical protein